MATRALVVDDNPTNLKLACDVLEADGFVVDRAADAEQAQAVLAQRVPDIILMDVTLPGMDGLTLTRKLKTDARYWQVPVIALTAFALKGDDRKALDAGCAGYITKPIDTRQLPKQVLAILGRAVP